MKILTLDDYFDNNTKSLVFFLGIISIFGLFNIISSYINLNRIGATILFLSLLTILIGILKLKKALVYENNSIFNTILIKNKIVVKIKIDIEKYTLGSVKKLNKTNESWNWIAPIFTNIVGEPNAYSILLHSRKGEPDLKILSLTNSNYTNEVVEFIERNSIIKFPEFKNE